ncbi:uncharacterized protein SAMN02745823_03294 [Sporobacter termitidis DSM 10068]|uniref:HD domain-containing protein n=1 Tax=Sporobacter termitidis DSM 10068 TaxID=1123282 RepID=A0A1M5Z6V5_9FIRM|nr:HD domain-containing protein [Sporobacter termitidis]SHI19884.1 uncharacterized protein SAMN02745823_03294 [Sporobacter termitidis DSM 10068]
MPKNETRQAQEHRREYLSCVGEILDDEAVRSMRQFNQHGGVDCLKHCLNVSVASFTICKRLGLDYRSAARGGLLHDFFLYDWHKKNEHAGLHGFTHPKIAATNARRRFKLNSREQDVITKHMWPLTLSLPKYPETMVVVLVDKFFCIAEAFRTPGRGLARQLHDDVCAP